MMSVSDKDGLYANLELDVIMYEAGDGYGGTWRWNCYRE